MSIPHAKAEIDDDSDTIKTAFYLFNYLATKTSQILIMRLIAAQAFILSKNVA